jgi:RNA polymerase sigma factor (sigma-70 family)
MPACARRVFYFVLARQRCARLAVHHRSKYLVQPGFAPGHHWPDQALDPEERLLQQHTVAVVRTALEQLPVDFREVIVLREIEGLSHKEIAAVVGVPIGTVMSRLARARERLLTLLKLASPRETLR